MNFQNLGRNNSIGHETRPESRNSAGSLGFRDSSSAMKQKKIKIYLKYPNKEKVVVIRRKPQFKAKGR